MEKTLRLVLGDQLNGNHSWFANRSDNIIYIMMEIEPETTYVTHHIQKVAGFFAAMRRFAEELRESGHRCIYLKLDDDHNRQSFPDNLRHYIESEKIDRFEYMLPDEFRLDQLLEKFCRNLDIPCTAVDSEHFLTTRKTVAEFFQDKKTFVMEHFYRHMRREYNILMNGDQPLGGRWNYDAENRRSLPKNVAVPEALSFGHDLSEVVDMLKRMKVKTIGKIEADNFPWPLTRKEALKLLDYFLENCLARFGQYQDAMSVDHAYVFHSRLSFALNIKLLHPLEVVEKTVAYWQQHQPDQASGIAQVEGFVRQIIGWREFMRGIYWDAMPEYELLNYFDHRKELPDFYWTGDTKMNCLKQAIGQSLDLAYAHHIQRLMITGNFANLLGVHPDAVDHWYLGIYIDAIQWVEITNTRGMSQFADGGIAATKPYVSSANYINKMSDYCRGCHYNHKERYGEKACPFNSLYWDFFDRHRELLSDNPRVGMAYRHLDKMAESELEKIRNQAREYKENPDKL